MSKRNKKLKKLLRARALEQARAQDRESGVVATESAPILGDKKEVKPAELTSTQDLQGTRVKTEIIKILSTMGIIFAIIIAVYFINQKTDFVLNLGKWMANILNINL